MFPNKRCTETGGGRSRLSSERYRNDKVQLNFRLTAGVHGLECTVIDLPDIKQRGFSQVQPGSHPTFSTWHPL